MIIVRPVPCFITTTIFYNLSDRGDRKCNHDRTHRVCAKLVDNTNGQCKRLKWGTKDFWEITDQVKWEWSKLICSDEDRYGEPKPSGEHWCICMWATERLINKVIFILHRNKMFKPIIFITFYEVHLCLTIFRF